MIALPTLGEHAIQRVEQSASAKADGLHFVAGWCSDSRWVYVCELRDGEPMAWRLSGPMDRESAKELLASSFARAH